MAVIDDIFHADDSCPISPAWFLSTMQGATGIFRGHFSQLGCLTATKHDGTPVTEGDRAINTFFIERVRNDGLPVSIYGEEETHVVRGADCWLNIDPIDGTRRFADGHHDSVSQAAVIIDGRPIMSAISDPHRGLIFMAVRGQGAWVFTPNECDRLSVMQCFDPSLTHEPIVGVCDWPDCDWNMSKVCHVLKRRRYKWMQYGSIGHMMASVARGEFAATIFPGPEMHDTSAGDLLISEAGGIVTDIFGDDIVYEPGKFIHGHIAACDRVLHNLLVRLVQR